MEPQSVVIATDVALVSDHPAIAVVLAEVRRTGEIRHGGDHLPGFGPCGPYCSEVYVPRFQVLHLDRLERPGRERGLRPIAEAVLTWHKEAAKRKPGIPIYSLIDMSGTDAWSTFEDVLRRGPKHKMTGVLITSGEEPPSRAAGQRWLKIPRSALLANLETRLEQRQVEFPPAVFDRLRPELLGIRRVLTPSRSIVYETVAKHDDLVLALAMALWSAPPRPVQHTPSIYD